MKNIESNHFSENILRNLEIKNIKFTSREIDILACIIGGRGRQTTADLLFITDRTVEAHTRNIMQKLNCNSREKIREFIEKSDKYSQLKQHYSTLLFQDSFKQTLKNIDRIIGTKNLICTIYYSQKSEYSCSLSLKFKKDLESSGIQAFIKIDSQFQVLHKISKNSQEIDLNCIIYLIPESFIKSNLSLSQESDLIKTTLTEKLDCEKQKIFFVYVDDEIDNQIYMNSKFKSFF